MLPRKKCPTTMPSCETWAGLNLANRHWQDGVSLIIDVLADKIHAACAERSSGAAPQSTPLMMGASKKAPQLR